MNNGKTKECLTVVKVGYTWDNTGVEYPVIRFVLLICHTPYYK